jgi:hypothetical protein
MRSKCKMKKKKRNDRRGSERRKKYACLLVRLEATKRERVVERKGKNVPETVFPPKESCSEREKKKREREKFSPFSRFCLC